mmetsp:Transcript_10638/g.26833  ORF Transcript_10638/g.26833 Transcript_10638/m.26833 type:complete len:231 (-) Transcript_10638:1504-2196(-)
MLSSAGAKCIAQSMKRQQLCAACAWYCGGLLQPADASSTTSCAATQRSASCTSAPGTSGSARAWRRWSAQRMVSASPSESTTRCRPASSLRSVPDVSTRISCFIVSACPLTCPVSSKPVPTRPPPAERRGPARAESPSPSAAARSSSCSSGSVSVMSSAERSASHTSDASNTPVPSVSSSRSALRSLVAWAVLSSAARGGAGASARADGTQSSAQTTFLSRRSPTQLRSK